MEKSITELKSGRLDAVACAYYSHAREKECYLSRPLAKCEEIYFYQRKGGKIAWKKLSDLKGYRIGILRESMYSEEFERAEYLQKIPVSTELQNLKKLLSDRIDITPMCTAYLEHLLRVHFDNKKDLFEKIEPPFISGQDLYIMFSRKSNDGKKIRDDLNEEIEQMKKDGTYQQILNQHHLD